MYLIGLDNGGTSTKAAVFDENGREIAVAGHNTNTITPKPGYTERDMDELWQVNCACIREALAKAGIRGGDVGGVAVCGHGKGLYAWGRDGRPAYNGIISTDNRAWKYTKKWYENGVFQALYPQLCQEIMPCQQIALLAWFKDNLPDVYNNVRYVFSVKDYIRFRLTGEAYCEATDISGSGLMDVRNARFDREMLEQLGIGEACDMLSPIRYSYELCGTVSREAAELTGLAEGTPVAGGMFDIDACAVAADVTSPEELVTIAGTWSINEFISPEPIMDGNIARNSLFAIPGYYLAEESSATSSGNLEWFLENLLKKDELPEGESVYSYVNRLVDSIPPEECNVYYLPYLYGSNAHPLGKAAFVGMTNYHKTAHMLRAVYEGVVFSHKRHIEKLLASRTPPKAIRMAGGPVRSWVWVQMFADVLGYPIETVDTQELGALGCAMAAAIAAGLYSDYKDAARHMVRVSGRTEPDPARAAIYQKKYERYMAVSDALDTVWDKFEI